MTSNGIIEEAIRLVDEGLSVTLPVNGKSMLPFIIGGKESVILQKPETVAVGDIVLAWVEHSRYVVHRIISIEGDKVTLMGDGNIAGKEHCTLSDIKAKATYVVDEAKKRHYLYTAWRKKAAKVWLWLRPARRILLLFYKLRFIFNL